MENPKDGGPAFPAVATWEDGLKSYANQIHGMSLRDWIAGLAVAGQLSLLEQNELSVGKRIWPVAARNAYKLADAMLAEREKRKP